MLPSSRPKNHRAALTIRSLSSPVNVLGLTAQQPLSSSPFIRSFPKPIFHGSFCFNAVDVNSRGKGINRPADYDYMLTIAAAEASMGCSDSFSARRCERPKSTGLTGHIAFLAEQRALAD
jgi:hypothetical protein